MVESPHHLEVEVKFLLRDLPAFRARLIDAGIHPHRPRIYEHNIRFDNPWDGLARHGRLLRLRQDSRARLTYKGIPPQAISSEAKIREELEIEISDLPTTSLILQRLGFFPRQIYEKYRETFISHGVEIVLDEMPFGNFVELEGEEAALKPLAADLGLDWEKRILENYLVIMLRLQTEYNLPFDDLTFANFAGLDISAAALFVPT
ncbi:MAG: class IV adenylate cyclase [Anaerolineales bacterium]|nr:class IV adenylate cyclase [Anaerolineales bacterium]MCB8950496.1 class IV adenylate cyclase [Ardenticatenales bacterium]